MVETKLLRNCPRQYMAMNLVANRRFVILLLTSAAAVVFMWWLRTPPSKAGELQPLMTQLENHKATIGNYPASYFSFASFTQLTQSFSVYIGSHDTNGITWEPRKVSNHDFTLLIGQGGYEIFLPVGRMKMVSFSSFPVWRYDSVNHRWQKGRIHWSYSGSYWSPD